MDVTDWKGAMHVILISAAGAIVALAIAAYFPSIVPARAAGVQL